MKGKRCFKKTVTGISVIAMSVSVVTPAMPVVAAEQDTPQVQQENGQGLT